MFDTVFFRSPKATTDTGSTFQLPEDRDELEYGKVLLFFKLRLPGLLGRVREVSCAFVKYYDKYLVKGMYDLFVLHIHCTRLVVLVVYSACILLFLCLCTVLDYCLTVCMHTDKDELANSGFLRLYETTNSWEVIPVEHILGRLPIMKNYATPTIPSRFASRKPTAFPLGKADTAREKGSKLFYVNYYAMTWSRCKESLFR